MESGGHIQYNRRRKLQNFVLSMLFIKYLDDTYEEYEEDLKRSMIIQYV